MPNAAAQPMGEVIFLPAALDDPMGESLDEIESEIPKVDDSMLLVELLHWAKHAGEVLRKNREQIELQTLEINQLLLELDQEDK